MKEYTKPEMEIIELEKEDVLLTSCPADCSEYSSV